MEWGIQFGFSGPVSHTVGFTSHALFIRNGSYSGLWHPGPKIFSLSPILRAWVPLGISLGVGWQLDCDKKLKLNSQSGHAGAKASHLG